MAVKADKFVMRNEFHIGDSVYKSAWCDVIDGKETLGYCDSKAKIIYVKNGQNTLECLCTIIHESIHAMSDDDKIKLTHSQVYKLERAIVSFLVKNGLIKL